MRNDFTGNGYEVEVLDRTGDAEGFDCFRHGKFKVSRTFLDVQLAKTRGEWEAAFEGLRTEPAPTCGPAWLFGRLCFERQRQLAP